MLRGGLFAPIRQQRDREVYRVVSEADSPNHDRQFIRLLAQAARFTADCVIRYRYG